MSDYDSDDDAVYNFYTDNSDSDDLDNEYPRGPTGQKKSAYGKIADIKKQNLTEKQKAMEAELNKENLADAQVLAQEFLSNKGKRAINVEKLKENLSALKERQPKRILEGWEKDEIKNMINPIISEIKKPQYNKVEFLNNYVRRLNDKYTYDIKFSDNDISDPVIIKYPDTWGILQSTTQKFLMGLMTKDEMIETLKGHIRAVDEDLVNGGKRRKTRKGKKGRKGRNTRKGRKSRKGRKGRKCRKTRKTRK